MRYEYECEACRNRVIIHRDVDERNIAVTCQSCYSGMRRVISVPYVIANREIDKPENKYALGFSERDRYETAKRGAREYEIQQEINDKRRQENRDIIEATEQAKPMEQIAREMGVLHA